MAFRSRLPAFASLLLVACVNDLSVTEAPGHDFTRYRTWAFVEAPVPIENTELWRASRSLLAEGLAARGYERVEADASPDLFVAVDVSLRVSEQLRTEAHARQTLRSSFGRGGETYDIDRPSTRVMVGYEDVSLTVTVSAEEGGEALWRAVRRREVRGRFDPHLADAMADVLAEVPARASGG